MKVNAYCCIPKKKSGLKEKEGSCPDLLYDLIYELEDAVEVNIAFYLFNNPVFYAFLRQLAQKGCKINIISIPIRGYSNKETKVRGYKEKISAHQKVKEIYDLASKTTNISLKMFPHQYIWYGALYAGGGATYSFHVKAILARFSEGTTKCFLSSGNFMFTDPSHSDNFVVIENGQEYEKVFDKFFKDLNELSVPFDYFLNNYKTYKDEFMFCLSENEINLQSDNFKNCFFTTPFYKYDNLGSNHYAVKQIIDLINKAEKRIWICAQHFHDTCTFDSDRKTIMGALYEKFQQNKNMDFKFLKQVPHTSLADKRRSAITETLSYFIMNAEQRYNKLAHDKFMLFDDLLFISTANYTSTQFAFGRRPMDFKDDEGIKHRKFDNFSEINGFLILPQQPEVVKKFEEHFLKLWKNGEDIKIKI